MAIRVPRKRADAYQHGNLRQALIQAGLKLLAEGGVPGLSLRAAAQLAGVSHAAPYRHFRDKDALVAAIAEEGFRLLTAEMRGEIAACRSPSLRSRLRAAGRGYVSFAVQHAAHFRIVFGRYIGPHDKADVPASLVAAGEEAYGVLRSLIAEGVADGQLRAGAVDELALATWGHVHGLGMLIIDGQIPGLGAEPAAARALADKLSIYIEDGLFV
jgi:AcrR family transcriptional regulator